MPISFLEDRHRAQRLGRVRLGVKKVSSKTGKEYPVATPYFVLDDAPVLKGFYGETPTALNIEFLWDNIEFTFPHYMRRYTASGLRCLGDGDLVLYRVNADGDVDVRDGNAVHPSGKVVMDGNNQTVKVHCEGETCPSYEDGSCKPTGYLRFLPIEAPRLGYYDVVCHQRAVVGILTQLKLTLANFHHLTGIPFILHRGEEERVPVKIPGKGMVDMPIRTQWVEINPEWFAANWQEREKHRELAAAKVKQDMIDLFGEDVNGENGDNLLPPPAVAEAAAPVFEGEKTELTIPNSVHETTGELVAEGAVIQINLSEIETIGDLFTAAYRYFGLYREAVLKEVGVKRQEDLMDLPRDIFLQIAEVRGVEVVPL